MMPEYLPIKRAFRDLSGQRFGRLTVIRPVGVRKGRVCFLVICDCGKEDIIPGTYMSSDGQQSCGCLAPRVMHGRAGDDLYEIWRTMVRRCRNPKDRHFADYGGRGIRVCDRWLDIRNFIADMTPRPSNRHSIDRIDNDGNYEPGNCRWATQREQMRNMRSNLKITWNGKTQTLPAWADEVGISRATIRGRILNYGWPVERALTEKPRPWGR